MPKRVYVRKTKRLGNAKDFLRQWTPRENVLICGAGASLNLVRDPRFPLADYTVIACNSAGLLVYGDLYMAFDLNAWRFPWWNERCGANYLIGKHLAESAQGGHCPFQFDFWEFDYVRTMRHGGDKLERGVLKGGATISGCAVQLAASNAHVRRIDLIGCEFANMRTHFYDDDEYRPVPCTPNQWGGQHKKMTMLCRLVMATGIKMAHWGTTALPLQVLSLKSGRQPQTSHNPRYH